MFRKISAVPRGANSAISATLIEFTETLLRNSVVLPEEAVTTTVSNAPGVVVACSLLVCCAKLSVANSVMDAAVIHIPIAFIHPPFFRRYEWQIRLGLTGQSKTDAVRDATVCIDDDPALICCPE